MLLQIPRPITRVTAQEARSLVAQVARSLVAQVARSLVAQVARSLVQADMVANMAAIISVRVVVTVALAVRIPLPTL